MSLQKAKTFLSVIGLAVLIPFGATAETNILWDKVSVVAAGSWNDVNTISSEELDQLKSIANTGDANAQFALGVIYQAKHQYREAEYWLKLAADQGHMPARYSFIENAAGHAMAKLDW